MINPLVSIIVPVFNGANFLEECINSALEQTYKNIEIIVVNDGSNDNGETRRIAKRFGDKIRYFEKENGGVSSALNLGIKEMQGELFSWLSHDDLYYAEKIEIQVNLFLKINNDKCVIFSNSESIDTYNNKLYSRRYFKHNVYTSEGMYKMLLTGKSINGCSLLIPRGILVEAGLFDERFRYIQDWKMWVSFCLINVTFVKVNSVLVKMRVHNEQQTVKINKLFPLEVETFLTELLSQLLIDSKYNINKLKVLSFNRHVVNNSSLRKRCIQELRKLDKMSIVDNLKYMSIKVSYPALLKIKQIYHSFNRRQ